jgi:5-methylthioadenosine/S-adenosylhomocysteine deaminase
MKIHITNILLNGEKVDILIEGRKIIEISRNINIPEKDEVKTINGEGKAILPSLFNGHTHSPMVLLRGYGDDMLLDKWLTECIWPVESKLTDEDYYWGYRLAFIEMIKSGTTFFNEMYMNPRAALEALEEIPMKGLVNFPIIDGMNEEVGRAMAADCELFFNEAVPPEGVQLGVAVHSIYANSLFSLEWVRDFASERDLKIHIHLSETEKEVSDCMKDHNGLSPVEYLDSLDFLSDRVIAAHTVWLSEKDMDILAERHVTVVHNPVSNMKLASGKAFPFKGLKKRGGSMLLGTDGAASNNNLDLFEEMKIAALLQKHHYRDPTLMSANEIFHMASKQGAEIFSTGGGDIKPGAEADLLLFDIDRPEMVPMTNLISNVVYSASGHCVDTVICGGKILMESKKIPGEEDIRLNANKCTKRLLQS